MRILLLMVIILASLSIFQSKMIYSYNQDWAKMVWGFNTMSIDFLAQRKSNIECHMHKELRM